MTQEEEERERKKQGETQSRQGTGDRGFRRKPTTELSQTQVETGPRAGVHAYSNAHSPGRVATRTFESFPIVLREASCLPARPQPGTE